MRGQGTKKIHSLGISDQHGREGFDVQITHQVGMLLNVQPNELNGPARSGGRSGHPFKHLTIVPAQAAPVGAQTNHPQRTGLRNQGKRWVRQCVE